MTINSIKNSKNSRSNTILNRWPNNFITDKCHWKNSTKDSVFKWTKLFKESLYILNLKNLNHRGKNVKAERFVRLTDFQFKQNSSELEWFTLNKAEFLSQSNKNKELVNHQV